MVAEVTITGNGAFRGAKSNLGQYSITQESMPSVISDSSGGVGEYSFDAAAVEDSLYLYRSGVSLTGVGEHPIVGTSSGVVESNGVITVSVNPALTALVAEHSLPPYVGTLEGAFQSYLDIVDYAGDLVYSGPAVNVTLPGGLEEIWLRMKELCALYRLEIRVEAGDVLVEPKFQHPLGTLRHLESVNLSVGEGVLARSVEVSYFNSTYVAEGLLYPAGGWSSDVQVYQVAAGEVTEAELNTGASIFDFTEPTMVTFVPRNYTGSTSVYAIAGKDGLPVPPALWTANGGSLSLELGDDTETIHMTLTGPTGHWAEEYGPFRVAMSADTGGSSSYSSLRIIGEGILMDERVVSVPTGIEDSASAQDIGISITSRVVSTLEDAYDLATDVANAYSGTAISLTLSASTRTPGAVETWPVSHFPFRGGIYRNRAVTVTPGRLEMSAEPAVRFSDIEDGWGAFSYGGLEDSGLEMSYAEFGIAPMLLTSQVV